MTTKIKLIDCEVCGRYMGLSPNHHRCDPPASAQTMQDWLELNAMDAIHEAFDVVVRYYLFESDMCKHLDDIERAHLLEAIKLKIEFRNQIDPEEIKEWLYHDQFKEEMSQ